MPRKDDIDAVSVKTCSEDGEKSTQNTDIPLPSLKGKYSDSDLIKLWEIGVF